MPMRIGRYTLHGEIGVGGMAKVHLGTLVSSGGFYKTVAIKRLHPYLACDTELGALLLEEARLAARVSHGNVVQMLDVIEIDREPLLVMEYVHGETLHRLVRASSERGERVPHEIAGTIVAGVLRGLHAVHEASGEGGAPLGLVHRDVSPQNVIVGVDGIARVLDFGIAKAAGRVHTTREGRVRGKLGYMSPEQLHGEPVTRQSDVYAAAVVLWELLTGQRLFAADTEPEVVARIENHAVDAPSEHVPGLPGAFNRATLRGLARDPEARYATALEMALALEQGGPFASPTAVGDWVRERAGEALAQREAALREVEEFARRAPDAEGGSRMRSTLGRPGVVVPSIALLIVAGAASAWLVPRWIRGPNAARIEPPMPADSLRVPVTPTTGSQTDAARSSVPHAADEHRTSTSTAEVAPPAAPRAARSTTVGQVASSMPPRTAATKGSATSGGTPDCDPPYVADDAGRLLFKRACLR